MKTRNVHHREDVWSRHRVAVSRKVGENGSQSWLVTFDKITKRPSQRGRRVMVRVDWTSWNGPVTSVTRWELREWLKAHNAEPFYGLISRFIRELKAEKKIKRQEVRHEGPD